VSNCSGSIYFLLYLSNLSLDINSDLEENSDVHFNPYKPIALYTLSIPLLLSFEQVLCTNKHRYLGSHLFKLQILAMPPCASEKRAVHTPCRLTPHPLKQDLQLMYSHPQSMCRQIILAHHFG